MPAWIRREREGEVNVAQILPLLEEDAGVELLIFDKRIFCLGLIMKLSPSL